jgi:hypothetical protein
MVQLTPKKIDEIGLKPGPDGTWICCKAYDGYALFDAEVTISALLTGHNELGFPEYDWRIVEILAYRPKAKHRFKYEYEQLTGAARKDCEAWLLANEDDLLCRHVEQEYSPSSDGAMADQRRAEAVS